DILDILGFSEGNRPLRYLDIPLVVSKLQQSDYKELVERRMKRLLSWLCNSLSFGRRLQLITVTLFSLHVFQCRTFILPVAVIEQCESIIRSFLWFGLGDVRKAGKVAWNKVCKPKTEGGLGIKNLRTWNKAAILEHGWDIIQSKNSLWVKWCYQVLLKGKKFWAVRATSQCSWQWRKVLQLREVLTQNIVFEIRDGHKLSLWFDPWLQGQSVISRYGYRVRFDSGLPWNATVTDVISNGAWDWPTNTWELQEISGLAQSIQLGQGSDIIHWVSKGQKYSYKATWEAIRCRFLKVSWANMVWFSNCIPKHSFCLWLSCHYVYWTRDKLQRFRVVVSNRCIFGCGNVETIDHLFFGCSFTGIVWKQTLAKCGYRRSVRPWNEDAQWAILRLRGRNFKIWIIKIALAACMYHRWMDCNSRIFRNELKDIISIQNSIWSNIQNKCQGMTVIEDNPTNRDIASRLQIPDRLLELRPTHW
ncbi:zf-RVT domain-containing protein, partial [Cephalotus follicularis]